MPGRGSSDGPKAAGALLAEYTANPTSIGLDLPVVQPAREKDPKSTRCRSEPLHESEAEAAATKVFGDTP